jgi:ribosomal protein S18 acetylase RimI-like enzyme
VRAPDAAAERLLAAPVHLHGLADGGYELARLDSHVVVAGEVAGVVVRDGLRVYSWVPLTDVAPEAVYEAVREAALDEPTPVPNDAFTLDDFLREWGEPDADLESGTAVLASDGSVAAFSFLMTGGDRASHGFTGTVREHRGRGLATAAKRTLRAAAEHGVTRVTTSNAEENAAMRALNRNLGFEQIGEHVIFGRDL